MSQENDIKTFVQEDIFVTTVDGNQFKVPRLNWRKELKLIDIIQAVLKDIGPALNGPNASWTTIVTKMLEVSPSRATKFVSIVMDMDDKWVEENLDIAEIVGVILPLLRSRLDLIIAKLQPYLVGVPGIQDLEQVSE